LNDVSLITVTSVDVEEHVQALKYSLLEMNFEKAILFSTYNPESSSNDYDFVEIPNMTSVEEWGKFIIFDLYKFITTKHIILIHADGFIVNPSSWDDNFLKYDYIGAPWPIPSDDFSYRDYYGNIIRQGNSISLRSYNILKMPSELKMEWGADAGYFHEDGFLCAIKRHILAQNGIKFAPLRVACKFSHETPIPETKGIKPFAFHKWAGANKNYPKFGRYNTSILGKLIKKISGFLWQK
jgi:hypothetical protein